MEWMLMPLQRYADFQGRSRRMEYWMFFLFTFVTSLILGVIDGLLGLQGASGYGVLGGLFSLATIIPSIAVGVRRMHDTDHSGWWLLLPLVNLIFAVTPGTSGPNRFGPDPMNPGGGADVFS